MVAELTLRWCWQQGCLLRRGAGYFLLLQTKLAHCIGKSVAGIGCRRVPSHCSEDLLGGGADDNEGGSGGGSPKPVELGASQLLLHCSPEHTLLLLLCCSSFHQSRFHGADGACCRKGAGDRSTREARPRMEFNAWVINTLSGSTWVTNGYSTVVRWRGVRSCCSKGCV